MGTKMFDSTNNSKCDFQSRIVFHLSCWIWTICWHFRTSGENFSDIFVLGHTNYFLTFWYPSRIFKNFSDIFGCNQLNGIDLKTTKFGSFSAIRPATPTRWYVCGSEYMEAVAEAMENAKERIFLGRFSNWCSWLSANQRASSEHQFENRFQLHMIYNVYPCINLYYNLIHNLYPYAIYPNPKLRS